MEGNNDGLLDELQGYSKEDLSKLAKAIDANKNEILKVSSTTQRAIKFWPLFFFDEWKTAI